MTEERPAALADAEQRIAELERQLAAARREVEAARATEAALRDDLAERDRRLLERDRELAEAWAHLAATADVLRIISQAPDDLPAVLATVLQRAAELAVSDAGAIVELDPDSQLLHVRATLGLEPEVERAFHALQATRLGGLGQYSVGVAAARREVMQLPDLARENVPGSTRAFMYEAGYRSLLMVPLIGEDQVVGVLTVVRRAAGAFPASTVDLLQTFANQSAIAIQNARLYQQIARQREELQERNLELSEALAHQTATADVLRIISQAPAELQTVLDAVAQKAAAVCNAEDAVIRLRDGDALPIAAHVGAGYSAPPIVPLRRDSVGGRVVLDRRTVHIPDVMAESDAEFGIAKSMAVPGAIRTMLSAPLLRGDEAAGSITIRRTEVRPFSEREIRALESFADQAVIAIENARLFNDLQQRNQELSEALDRERATGEILRVMSHSPASYQPVFDAVTESAARLCGADQATIFLMDGTEAEIVSSVGRAPLPVGRRIPVLPDWAGTFVVRERQTLRAAGLDDPALDPFPRTREAGRSVGYESALYVPLVRQDEGIGYILLSRVEARPFGDTDVALVELFADQAVIAIENARLFQELQARTRELEAKSQQLEEVSRHKSEFLASMSHELRTPLNAIIGFSEVLLDPSMPVDDAMRVDFLGNILNSGRHLLTLINDILDLSKVEAGKIELHPETFDPVEAAQGVHAVVRAMTDKKQQTLTLDAAPEPGLVCHDPSRFKQVLFNLLSNAVKFTPDGGAITTTLRTPEAGWLEIAVSDTGIGIAPADQGRIFEEFQQIDSGYARQQEGTGLGLALVRSFVQMMGGEIAVRSVVGEGSTFTVWLPRRYDVTADVTEGDTMNGRTVLLVEDDRQAADLLDFHLTRVGYRVERARTAGEALDRARTLQPAAITLDLRLPHETDGWGVLRALKGDPATEAIPVVVISVLDERGASRRAGAAAHLVKPVEPKVLLETLQRVVRGTQEETSTDGR